MDRSDISGVVVIHFNKKFLMLLFYGFGFICILFGILQYNKTRTIGETRDSMIIAGFIPFYWMVLIVGGIILLTLIYVSIRKYIGHKRSGKRRRKAKK